jgi:hypothetical protein
MNDDVAIAKSLRTSFEFDIASFLAWWLPLVSHRGIPRLFSSPRTIRTPL